MDGRITMSFKFDDNSRWRVSGEQDSVFINMAAAFCLAAATVGVFLLTIWLAQVAMVLLQWVGIQLFGTVGDYFGLVAFGIITTALLTVLYNHFLNR